MVDLGQCPPGTHDVGRTPKIFETRVLELGVAEDTRIVLRGDGSGGSRQGVLKSHRFCWSSHRGLFCSV